MLLRDLGVNHLRKGGWREMVQPYCNKDYQGMLDEYMRIRAKQEDYNSNIKLNMGV